MDSKQRHELETNDLREFLDNFKDFWDRNGNTILIVFIVVVGGYAGYSYYNNWQIGKQEDASAALTGAASPEALLTVGQEHDLVFEEAYKRAGDQFHDRARDHSLSGDTEAANEDLDKASKTYQALIDGTEKDLYLINAYLGLARVAESSKDWDAAEDYYTKAKEIAGETYTTLAGRAEQGLEMLDSLRHPYPVGIEVSTQDDEDTTAEEPVDDGVPPSLRRPNETAPGEGGEDIPAESTNEGE